MGLILANLVKFFGGLAALPFDNDRISFPGEILAKHFVFHTALRQPAATRQAVRIRPISGIVEWKRGEATEELHQISEDEANVLMERFKQRWEGAS